MRALPLLLVGLSLSAPGCLWQSSGSRGPYPPGTLTNSSPADRRVPRAAPAASPGTRPLVELGLPTATLPDTTPRQAAKPARFDESSMALPKVAWRSDYESTRRRPIQTVTLGQGARRVFVTGSLNGNDPTSVQLMDALAGTLTARPELLDGLTVLIVRNPNPDALAEHISVNIRGVNLNRNFPSARFTALPTQQTGPTPASEAETRILLRLVGDFQPQTVIHVRSSTTSGRPYLMGNADEMQRLSAEPRLKDADLESFGGEYKAGSLEEFSAVRLKAEPLLVEVPGKTGKPSAYVGLMLALLGISDVPGRGDAATPQPAPPPSRNAPPIAGGGEQPESGSENNSSRGPATLTGRLETEGPDGRGGYVEFLPPPPDRAPEPGADARYHELTPPLEAR